jgi:hypothetical protein
MTLLLPELDEALVIAAERRARSRRFGFGPVRSRGRWLRRPLVVVIVLVGVSGSVGGLALAGTLSSPGFAPGTIGPQAWVDGQRVTPETTITPDQASLAVLRQFPGAAADALPPYYVHAFTDSPAAANGVNVSLSRRAYGFSSGAAWVVPANGGVICLVADNAAALQMNLEPGDNGTAPPAYRPPDVEDDVSCQSVSSVATGWPLSYGFSRDQPGMTFTAGIVPDGVTQITIGVLGGPPTTLAVHDNVWMGEIPGVPDSETFTGPHGQVNDAWAANPPPTLPARCKPAPAHEGVC